MSVYDDPELIISTDFVKFETIGDTVTGVILDVGKKVWDDGKASLQYQIRTPDGDRTLTASQIQLATKCQELRPVAGDTLTATLTKIEKRSGGKTLKHFDVDVTKGDGTIPEPEGEEAF